MNVFSLNGLDLFVAVAPHTAMPSPILLHVEGMTLRWGGMFAKISDDVFFGSEQAVQLGHDVGALIPHVPIPLVPPNPMLAAHTAFSSCKAMFGKSRVLVNGVPAAWYMPYVAMLHVCADPLPLPIAQVPSVLTTTVKFGFERSDLLLGYADIALDQALTAGLRRARAIGEVVENSTIGQKAVKAPLKAFLENIARRITDNPRIDLWRPLGLHKPAAETLAKFLEKGFGWVHKKAVGKVVPTKTRDIAAAIDDASKSDESTGDAERDDVGQPPDVYDPANDFDEGMLDEVPLLGADP